MRRAKVELERQLENNRLMLKSQQREWESERLRLEEQVADLQGPAPAHAAAEAVPAVLSHDVRLV